MFNRNLPFSKYFTKSIFSHICERQENICPPPECLNYRLRCQVQQWFCKSCRNDALPFNCVSNHEILSDHFNSNEYCSCKDTTDLTDFDCLDTITELNLNKLNLNNFHPNSDSDIDPNLNSYSNFQYYTIHEFHKLCNKLDQDKSPLFSLMHTYIFC